MSVPQTSPNFTSSPSIPPSNERGFVHSVQPTVVESREVPFSGVNDRRKRSTSNDAGSGAADSQKESGGEFEAAQTERRQFGNTYHHLSAEGQELAQAIDKYKMQFRRRYITTDEILSVLKELGYHKS